MKKWHRRKHCKCKKGFKTYGGFKLWFLKIRIWKHKCKRCKDSPHFPKGEK